MPAKKRHDILRDIHVVLPGVSADYSGACSVLYELGGMVIVHGPFGCGGNAVNRDEPRSADMPSRVFSSNLTDMDATMGRDEVLIQDAVRTFDAVGGKFVAVIGTPPTMVNGTDYDAVAAEIGRRCGVPAFGVGSSGTGDYTQGAAEALLAVAKMLVGERGLACKGVEGPAGERPRTVNLLGAVPLDIARREYVDAARRELETRGWPVVSCWSMGSGLDELRAGLGAGVNVVLTSCALPLARWMREVLGIPYVWGTLSGPRASDACAELLERVVASETHEVLPTCGTPVDGRAWTGGEGSDDAGKASAGGGLATTTQGTSAAGEDSAHRALVVADQVLAESLRRSLELDAGFCQVDVACLTDGDPSCARPSDRLAVCELELARLVNEGGYDVVVGDRLLAGLMRDPDAESPRFIPVQSVALSGRFLHQDAVAPYGPAFLEGLAHPRRARDYWYPSSSEVLWQA